MKTETYMRGAGKRWGIWNTMQKEFQFGIDEPSPMLAEARLAYKIGYDSAKYRFEVREIPQKKKQEDTADED